jgi:hypothetical protein
LRPDDWEGLWEAVDARGAVVFSGQEEAVKKIAGPEIRDWYRLVDGERRWRAAELAGIDRTTFMLRLCDYGVAMIAVPAEELADDIRHAGPA